MGCLRKADERMKNEEFQIFPCMEEFFQVWVFAGNLSFNFNISRSMEEENSRYWRKNHARGVVGTH